MPILTDFESFMKFPKQNGNIDISTKAKKNFDTKGNVKSEYFPYLK